MHPYRDQPEIIEVKPEKPSWLRKIACVFRRGIRHGEWIAVADIMDTIKSDPTLVLRMQFFQEDPEWLVRCLPEFNIHHVRWCKFCGAMYKPFGTGNRGSRLRVDKPIIWSL
jgi:hypothetical protein